MLYKVYFRQSNANLKQRIQPAWDRPGWTVSQQEDWGILCASDSPRSTATPPPSSGIDSLTSRTMATSRKSTGPTFPILTCSLVDLPARICQLLAREPGLRDAEVDSFMSMYEHSSKRSHGISSGKTSKVLSRLTADGILPASSMRFPKLGILSGGRFSTPVTSECRRTESASLSSVLEPTSEVPEKYFLKAEVAERILTAYRRKPSVHTAAAQANTTTSSSMKT